MTRFSLKLSLLSVVIGGGAALAPGVVRADQVLPVHLTAAAGQQALSVFSAQGDVLAAACAGPPCSAAPVSLGIPSSLRARPVRAEVVVLGAGRRAVVVTVADGAQIFQAVVAAPLASGAPHVVFAGAVGLLNGQEGMRSGPLVQVTPADATGARHVLVGEQHESISLCGRPAILAPQLLSPDDLQLHAAKVQRLAAVERDSARQVKATRIPDQEPSRAARSVLSALAASSALGPPQALTDGDPETIWSEDVGGSGKGEFVVMQAPPELPISGLELSIRPKVAVLPDGAAPERLFLVGTREVVQVTLPEDAWQNPGARYRVELEPPLQSSCLALVLDTAFDQSRGARVSVAELSVLGELSAGELPALVATLAGGGQRAQAAKALLVAGGAPAFAAVAQSFDGLDEGGKRVALEIMDQAPCAASAATYVAALVGKTSAQVRHAQGRLSRCGSESGSALVQALAKADKSDKQLMPLLVEQLTAADPARAVTVLMGLMDEKTVLRRRLLRTALAQAARAKIAEKSVRSALVDTAMSPVARIDLLRALGDAAPRYQPEAGQAFVRLWESAPEFRARYLLLGPSAALSSQSAEADRVFRKSMAIDPDPHVRAAAVTLVRAPERFRSELLKALDDPEVRVREASARALAAPQAAFAAAALTVRLERDEWPLVRAAAADALARYPAGTGLDQPLMAALTDDSALVRTRSIRALGERRVAGAADRIRDRLIDADEWPEVRAEAARALGSLCDVASADVLAAFAHKLADPMASPEAQLIAASALRSLVQLAPPDLQRTLAPLVSKKAPPQARRAAATAVGARDTCAAQRRRSGS